MLAAFALSSAGAKRLIAQGVCGLPEMKNALQHGRVIIAGGTTNAYIVEELGLHSFENKALYTAGIITNGRPCITPADQRISPMCLEKGQRLDVPWEEFLAGFGRDDVFIKGANAIDASGVAGILMANPSGGTIGGSIGILAARGANLIVPVGHEKMIPSCRAAAETLGIMKIDESLGMRTGFMMLPYGRIITEIQALEILFRVKGTVVAAGGVGGMEGSVMMTVEGPEERVRKALALAKRLIREKPISGARSSCKDCPLPCSFGTNKA